ncbi:uncharacterized protein BDZ99DRAFT_523749 [Mytilinidion resinicola]|uniref:Uncharacterized protein n=1 Tax=Mytilinidion resinicola TaxID=574789 RepID=A0A6A6YC55_9PEZI|nr:uncharacterized protein BDZ99DRAFT_523749 [Mytilinidion resinicola]KAF2806290.1 hypothetical protein BDZ99DRAFT_523749 [Mytilinidion resinicola]
MSTVLIKDDVVAEAKGMGTEAKKTPNGHAHIAVPSEYHKQKIEHTHKLLEREKAILDAMQSRQRSRGRSMNGFPNLCTVWSLYLSFNGYDPVIPSRSPLQLCLNLNLREFCSPNLFFLNSSSLSASSFTASKHRSCYFPCTLINNRHVLLVQESPTRSPTEPVDLLGSTVAEAQDFEIAHPSLSKTCTNLVASFGKLSAELRIIIYEIVLGDPTRLMHILPYEDGSYRGRPIDFPPDGFNRWSSGCKALQDLRGLHSLHVDIIVRDSAPPRDPAAVAFEALVSILGPLKGIEAPVFEVEMNFPIRETVQTALGQTNLTLLVNEWPYNWDLFGEIS